MDFHGVLRKFLISCNFNELICEGLHLEIFAVDKGRSEFGEWWRSSSHAEAAFDPRKKLYKYSPGSWKRGLYGHEQGDKRMQPCLVGKPFRQEVLVLDSGRLWNFHNLNESFALLFLFLTILFSLSKPPWRFSEKSFDQSIAWISSKLCWLFRDERRRNAIDNENVEAFLILVFMWGIPAFHCIFHRTSLAKKFEWLICA